MTTHVRIDDNLLHVHATLTPAEDAQVYIAAHTAQDDAA